MNPALIVLLILISLGLIFAVWCFIEPHFLEVSRINLRTSRGKEGSFTKLGKGPEIQGKADVRLFFFSDIHAEMCYISPERLLGEILKAHKEDAIEAVIFGGDISTSPKKAYKGIEYLSRISKGLKELGIPFYGVTGNHDLEIGASDIERCGFTNLEGQIITLKNVRGEDIVLTGADDSGRYNRVWIEPPHVDQDRINILTIHDPDAIVHIMEKPDFMLSGHLHGGQLKLPFKLVFRLLRSDELPMNGILEGVFEYGRTGMFISRGLGCGTLPIRFLSVPEASIVSIYLENEEDTSND